jgi:hypothetical protein
MTARYPEGPAMTATTTPATTALLDQAQAASGEALHVLHGVAQRAGWATTYREPGPVTATIIDRLRARGLAGQLTLCEHLSYTAPAVAVWLAYAPGRLRCLPCTGRVAVRVKGTREDRRCDHCRAVVNAVHSTATLLPPVVLDLAPLAVAPTCTPPILVQYGLCPSCRAADAQPEGCQ